MIYIVKSGDTLSAIARDHLGDASRYMEIANLNGIKNPDLIHSGQRLQMPQRSPEEGGGLLKRILGRLLK